ncbi:hypothetical protein L3Y34_005829 [Caenorhabditis briggsae]|nr:hypothetical protein L3Y34_005829 [Caenorhabditis briggsae]
MMNFLSTFRLMIGISGPIVLIVLVLFMCSSKNKARKVGKKNPEVKSRSQEGRKKKALSAPNSDPAVIPKHEDVPVDPPKEVSTPAGPPIVKSNRKKNKKTETVSEAVLDPTQESQQGPGASVTITVCPTQEDDPSISAAKAAKSKIKEEYFDDQNDDDTLACVKSIEN